MKKKYDHRAFHAHVSEEDILFIEFKKVKELFVEDMVEVNACFNDVKGAGTTYVVVSFGGFLPMKDDVMAEVKRQREKLGDVFTVCVIRNIGIRLAIKFFMGFYSTSHPIHIVATQKEAASLIKKHRKEKK